MDNILLTEQQIICLTRFRPMEFSIKFGTVIKAGRSFVSLGSVVNILAIFSNANILKNKRIKICHINGIGCPLLISIKDMTFFSDVLCVSRPCVLNACLAKANNYLTTPESENAVLI